MNDQKILSGDEISWYEDEETCLDYRMVFEGDEVVGNERDKKSLKSEQEEENVNVRALLKERDEKWKKRFKKVNEETFKKGFQRGEQHGIEQTRKEMDERFARLEDLFKKAHEEWVNRQDALNPGMLDLVFDIVETVVDLPMEHVTMKEHLEKELSVLLYNIDEGIKPVLNICEEDYNFVAELVEKYAPKITIDIRKSDNYNPGEFEFDTDKETVVYKFKEIVKDFRENLTLPTWK